MLPILADNHVSKIDGVKRTLVAIDGTSATPEQLADLISFRSIGFDYYCICEVFHYDRAHS